LAPDNRWFSLRSLRTRRRSSRFLSPLARPASDELEGLIPWRSTSRADAAAARWAAKETATLRTLSPFIAQGINHTQPWAPSGLTGHVQPQLWPFSSPIGMNSSKVAVEPVGRASPAAQSNSCECSPFDLVPIARVFLALPTRTRLTCGGPGQARQLKRLAMESWVRAIAAPEHRGALAGGWPAGLAAVQAVQQQHKRPPGIHCPHKQVVCRRLAGGNGRKRQHGCRQQQPHDRAGCRHRWRS